MTRRIAAALLLAVLLPPAAAPRADDTVQQSCAADAQRFCPTLGASDPKLDSCLGQHSTELSPACYYARKGKLPRKASAMEKPPKERKYAGCMAEIAKYCPGQEGKEAGACLATHKDSLSAGCASAVEENAAKHKDKQADDGGRGACKADRQKLCAGQQGEAAKACLQQHQADLSAGCRAALPGTGG